jgi:hypothetical protein
MAYWTYWAGKGNLKAQALLMAGTEETLTRLADRAFGVSKEEIDYHIQTTQNLNQNEQILVLLNQVLEQNKYMISEMQVLKGEIHNLKPIAEQYKRIDSALDYLQELKPLLEKITEELKANPNQNSKSLKEWLDFLGLPDLDRGKKISLGNMISSFFKVGKNKSLLKTYGNKGCYQYPEAMIPLIEKCYQYVLLVK